MISDPI